MKPLTVLRKEHTGLRDKLSLLEQLLPLTPANALPIRELEAAISRSLRCHCEQESYLLSELETSSRLRPPRLAHDFSEAHEEQLRTLRVLHEVLAMPQEGSGENRTAQARHLIHRLRTLMVLEEDQVFGLLEGLRDPAATWESLHHLHAIAAHAHRAGDPAIPPSCDL